MMRWLWLTVIDGKTFSVIWWAAFSGYSAAKGDWTLAAVYAALLALNAYSWDYQRRRRAGGAS